MKKLYESWSDIEKHTLEIARQISSSRWRPDYVVGITRGGLVPASLLSQWFDCTMYTLDAEHKESNLWMCEDVDNGMNILLVNSINLTGDTINWIIDDWQLDDSTQWNQSVRFACIYDNLSSKSRVKLNYCASEISSSEIEVVFPWQEWWSR